jgi:hypothetical protein
MKTGQNFTIGRGEQRVVRFVAEGGAGATTAAWHIAEKASTPAGQHDLDLSSTDGGITLTDAGEDAYVDLHFTSAQTEALPLGLRWHELWVTVRGLDARRATGKVKVEDTLKS